MRAKPTVDGIATTSARPSCRGDRRALDPSVGSQLKRSNPWSSARCANRCPKRNKRSGCDSRSSRSVSASSASSKRITIRADNVEIGLTEAGRDLFVDAAPSGSMRIATVMKAGVGGRQIVPRDGASARVDRSLVKAIAWARDLRQRLERDGKSLDELAREDGCSRPYVSSMIRLAYLAPGITQSILDGTQPAQLTLADLMQRDIPADWSEQRIAFGFL